MGYIYLGLHMTKNWKELANPGQIPYPEEEWDIWAILGGRGSGTTRAAAEYVHEFASTGEPKRIVLAGLTITSIRNNMIEGPSGLLAVADEETRPSVRAGRTVWWPNGSSAQVFQVYGAKDILRGPQAELTWINDFHEFKKRTLTDARIMTRLGKSPKVILSASDPKDTPAFRRLRDWYHTDHRVAVNYLSTFDNVKNLDEKYVETLIRQSGGAAAEAMFYGKIPPPRPKA